MARIGSGGGDAVVARPEMPFVLRNEQGLFINTSQLSTPDRVYDADVAWVERKYSSISFYFGKLNYPDTDPLTFHSRLEVRYSIESFREHFWKNSRTFHEKMREAFASQQVPNDPVTRPDPSLFARTKTDRSHSIWANFELMSHSGGEACVDLYHLNPRSIALLARSKDSDDVDVMSVARLLLPSAELLALLDACDPIIKSLPQKVGTNP
ncbi:MAG: hypothetical protein JNM17_13160 [Archangium sp.]|nr:hypothetical protein [Archangium sp.]